jgi:hypothetical protein
MRQALWLQVPIQSPGNPANGWEAESLRTNRLAAFDPNLRGLRELWNRTFDILPFWKVEVFSLDSLLPREY